MKYIRNKNNKIHKKFTKTIKYKGINLEFTNLTMSTWINNASTKLSAKISLQISLYVGNINEYADNYASNLP